MTDGFRYRAPRRRSAWLVGMMTASLVLSLGYVAESLTIGLFYPGYYDVNAPFAPGEQAVNGFSLVRALLELLLSIPLIVVFCCWIFRANKNARALGAERMRATPGWSVGWWFIPIANLWLPYVATKQIYQASDPDAGPADWVSSAVPWFLPWWWAAWIVGGVVTQIDAQMGTSTNPSTAHASSWTGVLVGGLGALAAFSVIRVIRGIDERQLVKALESPAAAQRYCVVCDYDLSGSHGRRSCPECGTPIPAGLTGGDFG